MFVIRIGRCQIVIFVSFFVKLSQNWFWIYSIFCDSLYQSLGIIQIIKAMFGITYVDGGIKLIEIGENPFNMGLPD